MKKRLILVAAIIAVAAVFVTGASLAYFTAEDDKVNTFTVGKVDISLAEDEWDKLEDEDKVLIPGSEIAKDPTVTVIGGSEDCYVRLLVTVDNYGAVSQIPELGEKITERTLDALSEILVGYDPTVWVFAEKTVNKDGTATFTFNYFEMVEKSSTDTELEPLFTSIKVPETLTGEQLSSIVDEDGEFNIAIKAEAIQALGFDSVDEAMDALDDASNG